MWPFFSICATILNETNVLLYFHPGYNEVGGVPMISSAQYLKTLLREELNFTGAGVSGVMLYL